jgi:hypothetical protein
VFGTKKSKFIGIASAATAVSVGALAVTMLLGHGAMGVHTARNTPVIGDPQLHPTATTDNGGAIVLPTTRTVAHWFGQTTNSNDGITYGFNMVGADPNNCSGAACDVTIEADITPISVNVGGLTFDGTSVVNATLASPQFATNDYGKTPFARDVNGSKGPGGPRSQGDQGNQLQLEDATMRAQFNQTGKSTYHLRLHPNVLPAVTINVPANQGTLLQSRRSVIFGDVDYTWWSTQIHNLENSADATRLPIYLTNSVMLYTGNNPLNCCVIGYHGAIPTGLGGGSGNSNGNAVVQTLAWASLSSRASSTQPPLGRCRISTRSRMRSSSGRTIPS